MYRARISRPLPMLTIRRACRPYTGRRIHAFTHLFHAFGPSQGVQSWSTQASMYAVNRSYAHRRMRFVVLWAQKLKCWWPAIACWKRKNRISHSRSVTRASLGTIDYFSGQLTWLTFRQLFARAEG